MLAPVTAPKALSQNQVYRPSPLQSFLKGKVDFDEKLVERLASALQARHCLIAAGNAAASPKLGE